MLAQKNKCEAALSSEPRSLWELFCVLTLISLQGFGGMIAVIRRELVEKRQWMTPSVFTEEWSIAQIMPGGNVINLTFALGAHYFGLRGAFVALAGLLTAPLCILLTLGILYIQYASHPGVVGATHGMSAVAAGLVMATGIKMFLGLVHHPLKKIGCAFFGSACFVGVAWLHWPLLVVLLILGPCASLIVYWQLKRQAL